MSKWHQSYCCVAKAACLKRSLLFTDAAAAYGPNQELLTLIDYVIAFKYNQSDTERGGSEMARGKTKERASLGFDVFNDIVFVGSNCCYSHEFDFGELVSRWMRKGNSLPTLVVDTSGVIKRLQSKRSGTSMGRLRNDSTIAMRLRQGGQAQTSTLANTATQRGPA